MIFGLLYFPPPIYGTTHDREMPVYIDKHWVDWFCLGTYLEDSVTVLELRSQMIMFNQVKLIQIYETHFRSQLLKSVDQ